LLLKRAIKYMQGCPYMITFIGTAVDSWTPSYLTLPAKTILSLFVISSHIIYQYSTEKAQRLRSYDVTMDQSSTITHVLKHLFRKKLVSPSDFWNNLSNYVPHRCTWPDGLLSSDRKLERYLINNKSTHVCHVCSVCLVLPNLS